MSAPHELPRLGGGDGAGKSGVLTEAVAVFHDVRTLQAAIDDLLTHGFDHAELSVLASEATVERTLGRRYASTTELEDDPAVPRTGYIPAESLGDAQGMLISTAAYFPAIAGCLAAVFSGGTLLGAATVAVVAGGAGALAGAGLAALLGREHGRILEQHLRRGGLLLWVRTRDAAHERLALDILRRNSGADVHLHELPEAVRVPVTIPTRRPFLSLRPGA